MLSQENSCSSERTEASPGALFPTFLNPFVNKALRKNDEIPRLRSDFVGPLLGMTKFGFHLLFSHSLPAVSLPNDVLVGNSRHPVSYALSTPGWYFYGAELFRVIIQIT